MKNIVLHPVKPTAALMLDLERRGLIELLSTQNAQIEYVPANATVGKTLYETAGEFGTHKLISVLVRREDAATGIGYHPDREDFLVISTAPGSNPLFLIICYLGIDEFNEKVRSESLCAEDFIVLEMKYGDPETSFFTMKPYVLHGEATIERGGAYPVFYVTEPSDMPLILMDFGLCSLTIED